MDTPASQKVTAHHLKRDAYLYVRQSTLRQVFEHGESTQRQYALRQRAVALGWPLERIIVIDADLGKSGGQSVERPGFQHLVADVGMGKAGMVMGLEVSRLARNSTDWHRLLEICALTDTLILDEDGLYDPSHFNDRLLLGLKGTMSEAELHVLRARLQGGLLNKARRGALRTPLPVGLVYEEEDQVVLDPDRQVQESLRLFFATFQRTGSACGTVKYFQEEGLKFPRRLRKGINKGTLLWGELVHSRALQLLHNPRYAGAFVFGRSRTRLHVDGTYHTTRLPQDQWQVLLPHLHEGYIPWETFLQNQQRLRANAQALGMERRQSPPREGPALLQGLVLCGRWGQRMTIRYHTYRGESVPEYVCQRYGIEHGKKRCQTIPGQRIDQAVGQVLIETVTPLALDVALSVQEELQGQLEEADHLRQQQVERARYETELARRRYMGVDPDNRLVADALEAEWNETLRGLNQAQEEYERQQQQTPGVLSDPQKADIRALAGDFAHLWQAPQTPQRERKRIVRLLLEDVTLLKGEQTDVHVRFKGGTTTTLQVPRPLTSAQRRQTPPEVVAEIDHLIDQYTEGQIARLLNEKGWRSGEGKSFHPIMVHRIRRAYQLKSRFERLREKGWLTIQEMATRLDISTATVNEWRKLGLLTGQVYNDKPQYLYEPPGDNPPIKQQGKKWLQTTSPSTSCPSSE